MKIFTTGMPEICSGHIDYLKNHITIEKNFQQIIASAKLGELEKLCILSDVWNVSGRTCNCMRGQGAAETIHEIDPNIEILIVDGREFEPTEEFKNAPACFIVTGTIHEIKNKNELYLNIVDSYHGESLFQEIDELMLKFFETGISEKDIDPSYFQLDFIA